MAQSFNLPRFMSPRPRKEGEPTYVWQPGTKGRKAGFTAVRLNAADGRPSPMATAMAQSQWLNTIYDLILDNRKELARDLYDVWIDNQAGETLAGEFSELPQCPAVQYEWPGIQRPLQVLHSQQNFSELAESYRNSSFFHNLRAKTQRDYKANLRKIEEVVGDLPAASLKRARLRKIYEAWLTAHGPHTANARFKVLRLTLSWAVELEWIDVNPALRFRMTPTAGRIHFIAPEEHELLVKTAYAMEGREGVGDACELAYSTAQRRGDLVLIQDPQWTGKHIKLWISKTGVFRPLKATSRLLARVPEMMERRRLRFPDFETRLKRRKAKQRSGWLKKIEHPTLLVNYDTGLPYMEDTLTHHFQEVREQAALTLPSVALAKFSDYRDTAIIELRRARADIPSVTGHSPQYLELVFKAYADQFDEEVSDDAIDRLDNYRAKRSGE